jgi:5-methylcytosine-specific restriction endonuclease McrA
MTAFAVAPASREPVEPTARKSATAARRKQIVDAYGDLCAEPGCGDLGTELDHVIPLAMGGADDFENWQLLCRFHHLIKTVLDVKAIAKAKRLAGETGQNRRKREIRSRGFDKSKTRGFDGKVRERCP